MFEKRRALVASLLPLISCSSVEGTGSRSKTQNLESIHATVLGFEDAGFDWSANTGIAIQTVADATEGQGALFATINGYTEFGSVVMPAPGAALAQAAIDIQLGQSAAWGEVRLVVQIPSEGHYWRDLGSRAITGLQPNEWHELTFEVPTDVREALDGDATDVSLKVVVNAASGTAVTLDHLRLSAEQGGTGGGDTPGEGEIFSFQLPTSKLAQDYLIVGSQRVTLDDRCTFGEAGAPAFLAGLGTPTFEVGAGVTINGAVESASDISFLRSGVTVNGDVTAHGVILGQDNVSITGTSAEGISISSRAREWRVEWPQGELDDVDLQPDAPNYDLTTGAYDSVRVASRATLTLRSGSYVINSLVIEPEANLLVDTSAGPIYVYVKETLRLNTGLEYVQGERGQLLFGYLGNQAALFEEAIVATVVAPNSAIELRRPASGLPHEGGFFGKEVHVFSDARVLHLPFEGEPIIESEIPAKPPRELPPPPRDVGCYYWTLDGWVSVPCIQESEGQEYRPVTAIVPSAPPVAGQLYQFGQVETVLTSYGGVQDLEADGTLSSPGENSLSVQLNTNKFPLPTNEDEQAVMQFVVQKYAGIGTSVCTWQIDLTGCIPGQPCFTADYDSTCVGGASNDFSIPNRNGGELQAGDFATVAASTYLDGAGTPVVGMVTEFSWNDAPNTFQGTRGLYSVVVPDTLGLGSGWTELSGDFYGLGNVSTSSFTDSSSLTRLLAGSCANALGPEGGIPWPGVCPNAPELLPQTVVGDHTITAEETNMIRFSATPVLQSATKDLVYTQYASSTSGMCMGDSRVAIVRDSPSDLGVVPSNSAGDPFWESPDLFVLPSGSPVPLPDAIASEAVMTPGETYDVFVRVHNDFGCAPVTGVRALVNVSDPSLLSTPWVEATGGEYVGGAVVNGEHQGITVNAGESAIIGPISWTVPLDGLGDGHKCLLASIISDTQVEPADPFNAPASPQVAQRNLQVSECSYGIQNSVGVSGTFILELEVEGGAPSLVGGNAIELVISDSNQYLFGLWSPGAGSDYSVAFVNGEVRVRLGARSVTLPAATIHDGEAVTARGEFSLEQGTPTTTLRVEGSLFTPPLGGVSVQNGGSCSAVGPPVIK